MDNPQHYQPLSHALNPSLATQPQYATPASNFVSGSVGAEKAHEEEEEEEDDDEGVVEEQLHEQADPNSSHTSPGEGHDTQPSTGPAETNGHTTEPTANDAEQHEDLNSPPKRRPGRPRGSKNRMKAKAAADVASTTSKKAFQQPAAPANVNAQNQQYYEFQWRVLNLCAEFYGAAEELVKATSPLVIAQSYQMGPAIKIDPINMLNEAKKICDTLLANPSQLTTHPPQPMYTQIASFAPPAGSAAPSHSASSIGKFSAKPSAVPTNVQTFAVPLPQASTSAQQTQYIPTGYPPQPAPQFPTLPYYYTPPFAGTPYAPVAPTMSPATQPQPNVVSVPRGEGAWTDEEQERLKQLAEQSKTTGKGGDIDWDWVVHQWGNGRTRHQILIKATALGLKASSTRGQKRRRESSPGADEDGTPGPASTTSASAHGSVVPQATTSISPPLSQPVSAHASPAVQHSHPSMVTPSVSTRVSWPAPIIAANTPPIVTPSDSRGGYYKHRPSDPSMKPDSLSSHHYVYQPNGKGTGSKFSKQNGQ